MVLLTFPGQGAQRPGMLHALTAHPLVTATLAEASDVLGHDVRALDDAGRLASTVAVQLCLLVAGVASARHLLDDGEARGADAVAGLPIGADAADGLSIGADGVAARSTSADGVAGRSTGARGVAGLSIRADAVAGLSIGAYAAAVVAGVLDFADAVRLVALRGKLMEDAWPGGHGMTAILGLERGPLERLIAEVHSPDTPVYLANLNADTQFVIAGEDAAMARVADLALAAGARGAKRVAIAVPSHCPLLDAPAAALAAAFANVTVRRPRLRYFSASAARELRDPARIADDLAHNMALPVRWHETMLLARAYDVRLAVEMPPGNVLTKLCQPLFPQAVALADTRVDSVRILMAREA